MWAPGDRRRRGRVHGSLDGLRIPPSTPYRLVQLALGLGSAGVLLLGLGLAEAPASPTGADRAPLTAAQRQSLQATRTILVAIEAGSQQAIEAKPYDPIISIKLKLEAVGYRVVLDGGQAHEAVLLLEYDETPGRQYPNLEYGTRIACVVRLYHPAAGKVLERRIDAETAWPRPYGSLYWDAVQNLEENAYYYYLGELIREWLGSQADDIEVFAKMLGEPPLFQSLDGSDNIVTSRMAANQNARLHAIRELGARRDPRALETLWHLVGEGGRVEARAAIAAIGQIGDPVSIARLTELAAGDGPYRQAAVQALEGRRK